jgi:hypothetical protein
MVGYGSPTYFREMASENWKPESRRRYYVATELLRTR